MMQLLLPKQALNQVLMRCNLQVLQNVLQMREGDLAARQRFLVQQVEVFTRLRQLAEHFLAIATSAEEIYKAEAHRLGEACKVRHAVLHMHAYACICMPLRLQIAQGHVYILKLAQLDASYH